MKKFLVIVLSLMLLVSVMTGTSADEAEPSEEWSVSVENAQLVDFKVTEDGFYSVLSYGPYLEDPTGRLVDADMQTITDGAVFHIVVPEGMTLNSLYFIGKNPDGYGTTVAVSGIGTDSYLAYATGSWYRVSPNNLGVSGGTILAVTVGLVDKHHPYNIVIAGRQ